MKAVVLAAGENSRMWPLAQAKNKAMYEFLGKPLLFYTISELKSAGITDITLVISQADSIIQNYFGKGENFGVKITYAVQKKPLGMGNAVLSAMKLIRSDFFVVIGTQANCAPIIEKILAEKKNFVVGGRKTDNPGNYGILKLKGNKVVDIIEKPKNFVGSTKVVGVYLLPQKFLTVLRGIKEHQYSFEDALSRLTKKSPATCVMAEDVDEITLKYPWHILAINKILMAKYLKRHSISTSSRIHRTVVLDGNVFIGENVRIFENAVIKGPCYIADNAVIGNNVLIRDGAYIGRNVQVGHNSEVKNAIMYDNSHCDNSVILDSVIDEECRLGSNTITANRRLDRRSVFSVVKGEKVDSKLDFFGTIIGRNSAFGIHSGTMPGVKVGAGCMVGPGTILFKDIKNDGQAFHRFDE